MKIQGIMNELVKKETAVTSQEERIPQIGDHYFGYDTFSITIKDYEKNPE